MSGGAGDVLREAAALMRDRAEGANDGADAWGVAEAHGSSQAVRRALGTYSLIHDGKTEVALVRGMSEDREPTAAHIASWHPVVALAVADQLAAMAAVVEEAADGPLALVAAGLAEESLAVATAYLGTDQ